MDVSFQAQQSLSLLLSDILKEVTIFITFYNISLHHSTKHKALHLKAGNRRLPRY